MATKDTSDGDVEFRLPEENPRTAGGIGRVTQVSLAVLAGIAMLWVLREAQLFLMPTVLGGLLALAATPLCAVIERTGLPSFISALIVTVSIVVGLVTLGWYAVPSLDEWRYRAPEVAITLERKLRRLESKVEEVTETAAKVAPDMGTSAGAALGGASGKEDAEAAEAEIEAEKKVGDGENSDAAAAKEQKPQGPAEQIVEGGRRLVVNIIGAAPEILGALVYGMFLVYFLMAERKRVRRWAMMLARSRRQAARIGRTLQEIRRTVSLYVATITFINICLGTATGVLFWLIDMPAPILFGVLMALMNFMPYIGPLVVQACAFAVGFVTFNTLTEAFYPVGILLVLNTLEGQVLTPTILGRRLSASPLAIFLAVTFGAWMWGAIGAIVATPALIVGSSFVTLWVRESRRQSVLERYSGEEFGGTLPANSAAE